MKENMDSAPFISFCFSTYKRGEILRNTLESIRRQTYVNYEVIVSDNDPEGSGKSFVESIRDDRFKYFNNGKNLGMKPSFNKSLERSSGEYIVMIADDDPVYPDMLETLVKLKSNYPGYGMYMGGCDWFCEDMEVAKLYKLRVGTNSCISSEHDLNFIQEFSTPEFIKTLFSFGIFSHFLWSTCMIKKEVLANMGGIPDYGTPFLGDFAFMSIASTDKGCVVINKSLGCQTIHKENFGRNQNDHLPLLAKNFPAYLDNKLSYLKEWPDIRKIMLRFFSLWITGHMAFLHHYYKKQNLPDNGLYEAEKEVFKNDFIKKFRIKYFLKKRFPVVHDMIVKIKKFIIGKRK
jgi:glycosyltransferase involved in cell wall biosynthesis